MFFSIDLFAEGQSRSSHFTWSCLNWRGLHCLVTALEKATTQHAHLPLCQTASMEARLSRTDTKIEWVTQWQNRKSRLVNWIEPFYPQRKGRCQVSGGFEMAKVKTWSTKRPGWRDLQMTSSVIWLKNTETKMKFSSVWPNLHMTDTLQTKNTFWKKNLKIYFDV